MTLNPSRSPILCPDVGVPAPRFSLWYVRLGEQIFVGDRVAELLIDGATIDVVAAASGILIERSAHPDDVVTPGQFLGAIELDAYAPTS